MISLHVKKMKGACYKEEEQEEEEEKEEEECTIKLRYGAIL